MPSINPYNCTEPGHLFMGYESLLREILDGFAQGHSYALIGGRRSGKTSFLRKVENLIENGQVPGLDARPVYGSLLSFPNNIDRNYLFKWLYNKISKNTDSPEWKDCPNNETFNQLLSKLKITNKKLSEQSDRWAVIFLLDELDVALEKLQGEDTFFMNLRYLLMESDFKQNICIIATGVRALEGLITSGSSPLNNLRNKYLEILPENIARKLILEGFADGLQSESELLKLTGRHPYLLQAVLEKCWFETGGNGADVDKIIIRNAGMKYLSEHNDFSRWADQFSKHEHSTYQALANSNDGQLDFFELRNQVELELGTGLDDVLKVLAFHGVIDGKDQQRPEIAGTLFKEWYMPRYYREPTDA